ncbi:MAG: hypothetical protein ACJAU1_000437 [Psychromonas sp.]|jgi:hypothetical protein
MMNKPLEGSTDIVRLPEIDDQAKKQLALFTDPNVDGNTLMGYDIRPRFLHTRSSKVFLLSEYADRGDRLFQMEDGTVYAISPAVIDRKKSKVAIFPGTRESLVEETIMGFASRGEFDHESGKPGYTYDSSGLRVFFTLYQLWKRMQDRAKTYSHAELNESLRVLKGAGHYTGTMQDFGDGKMRKADGYGSYISDLIFVDNNSPVDSIKSDKFICVYLNREATKLILEGKYKLYDEVLSMELRSPIARYLYKYLIQKLRYHPQNKTDSVNKLLKQNQCILESGYQIQDNATKRKVAFLSALNELVENNIICAIDESLVHVVKHHRTIVEVEYTVVPTPYFFTYLEQVYERSLLLHDPESQSKLL